MCLRFSSCSLVHVRIAIRTRLNRAVKSRSRMVRTTQADLRGSGSSLRGAFPAATPSAESLHLRVYNPPALMSVSAGPSLPIRVLPGASELLLDQATQAMIKAQALSEIRTEADQEATTAPKSVTKRLARMEQTLRKHLGHGAEQQNAEASSSSSSGPRTQAQQPPDTETLSNLEMRIAALELCTERLSRAK